MPHRMETTLKTAFVLLLAAGAAGAQPSFQPVPLTLNSYTYEIVVPAGYAPPPSADSVTVTMENGQTTNDVGVVEGNTWYEIGTDPAALSTGLPHAGSIVTGLYQTGHHYQFASSWAANDCLFIAPSSSVSNSLTGQPGFYR